MTQIQKKESTTVQSGFAGFTQQECNMIRDNIAPAGTDDVDLKMFLLICQKKRLDPLQRQVYLIPRWDSRLKRNKMVIQTSIDGLRAIAARTGVYAGNDDPIFDNEFKPQKATSTVYRIVAGVRCPFTASARWKQYCPDSGKDFMWNKMPHTMLGKVAEALALRKAFPEDMSGLYTDDEMAQAKIIQTIEPVHPDVPPVVDEAEEFRAHLKMQLIEKGCMFEGRHKEAKAWIEENAGKTFNKLTAEDCQDLIALLDHIKSDADDFASAADIQPMETA